MLWKMYKNEEKTGTGDVKELRQNECNTPLHTTLVQELVVEIVDHVLDLTEYMDQNKKPDLEIERSVKKRDPRNLEHTPSATNMNHSATANVEKKSKMRDVVKHSEVFRIEKLIRIVDFESSEPSTQSESECESQERLEIFRPTTDDQLEEIDLRSTSEAELASGSPERNYLEHQNSATTTKKPKWKFISRIMKSFKRKNA